MSAIAASQALLSAGPDYLRPMRMHQNTVAGIIEALETSFGRGIYADKVVDRLLKVNKKWGSRDRAFVAGHTYEVVRNWRLLWALRGMEPSLKRKALWELMGVYFTWRGIELPDWPKFDEVRDLSLDERMAEVEGSVAIRESFQDWFHQLAVSELGEAWPGVAHALNEPARVALRANTLKCDCPAVLEELELAGLPARPLPGSEIGIEIDGHPRLNQLAGFQNGHFEVQDAGSQAIAPFVKPEPGMRVIDACAGAGGKSLHLAALMENRGQIMAMDVETRKLAELDKRAKRSGADIIRTLHIEGRASLSDYREWADRLLLDVPCSGSGVIRRNPDTKWKLQPEHLDKTRAIQEDILERYTNMLKPGGEVVYATCSIFKSENEDQVQRFLQAHPEYTLIEEQRIGPSVSEDGFYMARMVKTKE